MRRLIITLLLFSLLFAQDITTIASDWARQIEALLLSLVILAVVLAATAYMLAGLFGAEMRAKIQDWARQLLAASLIATMVLFLLYILMPDWITGGMREIDIALILQQLVQMARETFLNIIILLVVASALIYVIGQLFGAETRAKASDWSQTIIVAAIVAAFLYFILFEIIVPFAFQIPIPIGVDYKQTIALIVALMGLIVLITYLASKVLKIPEWEAYLTVEMTDLTTTILIAIFVFGLFYASTEFASNIMKHSGIAELQNAKSVPEGAAIILEKIIKDVETARTDCYTIQACTSVLNTFSKRTGESALNVVYKIYPGMDIFATLSGILANSLIMLEGSLKAQLFLIILIDALTAPLLLPAGIVLRFFPPTKDAGSFLLAVAIGLQIVYPTTYIINAITFKEMGVTYKEPTMLIAQICGLDFFTLSVPAMLIPKIVGLFSSTAADALSLVLNPLLSEATLMLFKISEYMAIVDYVAAVSLFGFFAPSLSMVITVAFINALTKFIIRRD